MPQIVVLPHADYCPEGAVLEAMPVWLTVLAPTMIAAMFGVSLVPADPEGGDPGAC